MADPVYIVTPQSRWTWYGGMTNNAGLRDVDYFALQDSAFTAEGGRTAIFALGEANLLEVLTPEAYTHLDALNDRLMPLHKSLFVESNPIPVKWALQEMGLMRGGIRLPLTRLSTRHQATVRQALVSAGCLTERNERSSYA